MKRNCLVLIFLFMLLLTASAFATSADICFKFNGGDSAWYGMENSAQIYVTNSDPVMGFTLGFEFASTIPGFSWKQPFGNKPVGAKKWIQEWNDAVDAMDGKLKMTDFTTIGFTSLPDSFMIGGTATEPVDGGVPLPAHATSTFCWELRLIMPASGVDGVFSIKPIFYPPGGSWKIDFGVLLGWTMPTFCGTATGTDPGAPLPIVREYPITQRPCEAPTFTNGPGAAVTHNMSDFTYDFNATVGEVPPLSFSAVGGTIDPATGVLTVHSTCQGPTAVTVHALNGCPGDTPYPFTITWTNDLPVITNCPSVAQSTTANSAFLYDFNATDDGGTAGLTWSVTGVGGSIDPASGLFSFTPPLAGIYAFVVTVTDACGGQTSCQFAVEAKSYNIVQIAKSGEEFGVENVLDKNLPKQDVGFVFQGTYTHTMIRLSSDEFAFAGYNLLIHYDASALSFVSAEIGPNLKPCALGGSGWEYFTYRFGSDGNCGGPCPSGLLRIVALAETNNGPNHPGCGGTKDPYNLKGVIADLKFYVTNDRNFECQYSEIGFAWLDCSDNTFSDPTGNKLYLAAEKGVHTFEWNKLDLDNKLIPCEPFPNMTGVVIGGFCPGECLADPNKPIYENLFFMNGGVDIACADSIDARGDINLNGIANEIADAVLFTNFFLKGISAFDPNPQRRQGEVAATDVNGDGHPLTVGDLVYLLRIIVGDALPITKLSPFASTATVNFANGSVSTESGSEIGAVYATFAINGAYNVASNTNMKVESAEVNGELKVLVFSGLDNMTNRIATGTNELFTVSGDVELKSVDVTDYYGNMLNTRVNKTSLPTSFALSQNVPNPFNPTTKLGFALPNQTEWTLSIYNVAGQLVKNFSGNNIGNVSVEWDASMAPSGVYFYKLNAGTYSDTKKMVLMK